MSVLGALTSDQANEVWVVSGRARRELGAWFDSLVGGRAAAVSLLARAAARVVEWLGGRVAAAPPGSPVV